MSAEAGTKAIITAFIANMSIAVAKFAAFLITGSSSMLSEAIHSVADSSNQILLVVGGKHSKAGTSESHPFGRTGARYVYGFVVAIIIFALGGVFSIYEGVHKIMHPEPLKTAWLAFLVLGFAMIMEGFALRTALKESRPARQGRSLLSYIKRSRDPELPVLLMEDSGALLGLTFAFVAVTASVITGNGVWDGIGSVAIGLLLIAAAVILLAETGSLLIGEAALPEERNIAMKHFHNEPLFTHIIHMRTLHVGPNTIIIAAKVAVPPETTIEKISAAVDHVEANIRGELPDAKYIFVEPDILKTDATSLQQFPVQLDEPEHEE